MTTVDADGALDLLTRLADGLDDPSVLFRHLGESLANYQAEVFATRGFGRWAPLDPATVKIKGNSRVLVDTGGLLAGLTRSVPGNTRVSGESVTLHSDEVSGLMAQRGARGMPKRNPSPAPPAAVVRRWADDLLEVLAGGNR